ncbi:hypothetical protein GCM10010124_16250 [Pilimelia terevasa]|uniref:Uncharacterized protein n=1 Tax=Pilimelia terevasa TaxID=53372 RepID=A0A8J3BSD7_9ACTN|nr:hypothetical protein [Pilimelia terevasa]GGK24475.1 hypothetical protein GCM10010124_16250 [Pilimelia terevasa]
MLKIARAALFAVLPAEVALAVLLVSGVALPRPVVTTAELAVLAVLLLEASVLWRGYRALRRGGARRPTALRGAYAQIVPEQVRRIMGFEAAGMVSLALWVGRRRHGVPPGAVTLPYHRELTGLMCGFLFACVVELAAVEVLLRALDAPAGLRGVLLALDAYGILVALAVIAGYLTRPHVVTADELRVRYGAFFDLRIPRSLVVEVRHRRNYNETGMITMDGDCMALAANSQTNVIVELAETVVAVRPLGRREQVRVLRFFVDDPSAAVEALRPSGDSAAVGPAGRAA